MPRLLFITHPEVGADPAVPVPRWRLSEQGIARMRAFAGSGEADRVTAVWASAEAKAIEAAGILAAGLGLGLAVEPALGEMDRSATGYLPPHEFERVADTFFARPEESAQGWERAVDAQARIRGSVERIVVAHCDSGGDARGGDLAIVSHGGVGALLLCAWSGRPIARQADQPYQGHWFTAELPGCRLLQGWREIAPRRG